MARPVDHLRPDFQEALPGRRVEDPSPGNSPPPLKLRQRVRSLTVELAADPDAVTGAVQVLLRPHHRVSGCLVTQRRIEPAAIDVDSRQVPSADGLPGAGTGVLPVPPGEARHPVGARVAAEELDLARGRVVVGLAERLDRTSIDSV